MSIIRPQDREPPPAAIAAALRQWEHFLEEDYGGQWRLRIDPEHAGEITAWGGADEPAA